MRMYLTKAKQTTTLWSCTSKGRVEQDIGKSFTLLKKAIHKVSLAKRNTGRKGWDTRSTILSPKTAWTKKLSTKVLTRTCLLKLDRWGQPWWIEDLKNPLKTLLLSITHFMMTGDSSKKVRNCEITCWLVATSRKEESLESRNWTLLSQISVQSLVQVPLISTVNSEMCSAQYILGSLACRQPRTTLDRPAWNRGWSRHTISIATSRPRRASVIFSQEPIKNWSHSIRTVRALRAQMRILAKLCAIAR